MRGTSHGGAAWFVVPAACIAAAPAYATQYLSIENAQRLLFPAADSFTPVALSLSDAQRAAISAAAHARPTAGDPRIWRVKAQGADGGWFIVDEVIGKVERITYALALDAKGTVLALEILDYRETHGYEVRNPRWRAQFAGRSAGAPLELGSEIKNISGATLSCQHITDGVRRLLALHAAILKGA
jgi:Na+-translocating ferredoxin:NAD+ oxidoreductase RnfG subunit